jgi:hypothetical protein
MAISFIGGGNRSTPNCSKSLTNFITWYCIEYTSSSTDCTGSMKSIRSRPRRPQIEQKSYIFTEYLLNVREGKKKRRVNITGDLILFIRIFFSILISKDKNTNLINKFLKFHWILINNSWVIETNLRRTSYGVWLVIVLDPAFNNISVI